MSTLPEPIGERPFMPGYGVEEANWSALPWLWAAERLTANRNYWVVTVSPESVPHAMPVWGVWYDKSRRFMFSCGPESRKARNLAHNSRVVVMTESTVECLSVEGVAHRVTDTTSCSQWIARYVEKYASSMPDQTPEELVEFLGLNALFEVVPLKVMSVVEDPALFSTRPTRWRL